MEDQGCSVMLAFSVLLFCIGITARFWPIFAVTFFSRVLLHGCLPLVPSLTPSGCKGHFNPFEAPGSFRVPAPPQQVPCAP